MVEEIIFLCNNITINTQNISSKKNKKRPPTHYILECKKTRHLHLPEWSLTNNEQINVKLKNLQLILLPIQTKLMAEN